MLNEPTEDIEDIIRKVYPISYKLSDTCFLISERQPVSEFVSQLGSTSVESQDKRPKAYMYTLSVERIVEQVKMSGENSTGVLGLVVKLDSRYGGYNYPGLWDWIETASEV